jgi:hypothetical protein
MRCARNTSKMTSRCIYINIYIGEDWCKSNNVSICLKMFASSFHPLIRSLKNVFMGLSWSVKNVWCFRCVNSCTETCFRRLKRCSKNISNGWTAVDGFLHRLQHVWEMFPKGWTDLWRLFLLAEQSCIGQCFHWLNSCWRMFLIG